MINCFKDTIHALMNVLLSGNDDDGHEEAVVDHRNDVSEEPDAKEDECQVVCRTLTLRPSLRKVDSKEEKKKKKVQWVDVVGIKELAEIREFEQSEDDMDSYGDKNCVCVIL